MTRRSVWLARAAWCAGAVSLAYLLAWAFVPPLVKWQGERQARQVLGRQVHIARVAFVPWRLDLSLEDVRVEGAPGEPSAATPNAAAPPLLILGRVHVDFAWSSIWSRAAVIQALEIDALRLRVSRLAAGRYDVDDLIQRLTPKPGSAPSEPAHFALYNVELRDAAIEFDDRPAARRHAVTNLRLAMPMLSNLPAQVDIKVEPRLSFRLNGVPFDTGALATPFAKTRSGALTFKVAGLDLAPYLGYLPDSLPVRVKAGVLTADLSIDVALAPSTPPTVLLRGTLGVADAQVTDAQGAALLAWRRLDVVVGAAAPLARQVALSSVRLEGARLAMRRAAGGRINLLQLETGTTDAAKSPASAARGTSVAPDKTAVVRPPWHIALDRLSLIEAAVSWDDATIEPAATIRIDGLNADATRIEWPLVKPIELAARGVIQSAAGSGAAPGAFSIDGSATHSQVRLKLALNALPLEALDAYLAQSLTPQIGGRLSAQARLDWSATPAATSGPLLSLDVATVDRLTFRERGDRQGGTAPREMAALTQLSVAEAQFDVRARTATVGRLAIDQPAMSLARGVDGRFDVERWKVAGAPPTNTGLPAAPTPAPWRIVVRDALLKGGRFEFADARAAGATAAEPLRITVDDLRLATQNLAWQGDLPTVPAQIEVSGRVGPPRASGASGLRAGGSFDWRGVVGVTPVLATGSLRVERLPLQLFMPYVGRDFGFRIARAELGYAGNLSVKQLPDGLDVDAGTDLLLGAVRIESAAPAPPGETLLSWNTLGLKSVRVSLKPGARPQVDIAQASIDDFYMRLVVTEEGKLNLSNFAASRSSPTAPAAPAPPASAGLPVDIRLEGTALTNGRIDFSDHFVRPNYSAALTELTGRLGAMRSDGHEMAALALRGKAAGTALLDISGAVNPLAQPLTLDLHAKATDLELAPLSPYAGKYAGYAIERGKLSMDVSYRLGADGRLDAKNQVVLNQLTFGAKIDSPTATKLPVLLAVALLKDRNGVIDLNLPISGSLADPQFSVGGIIGRLLGNLLVKALTSPFALLTGGSEAGAATAEPGQVEFVAGTSRPATTGLVTIDKVAQALAGKPKLLLTVTGSVDPAAEQDAYRGAVLEERLEAARRKQTVASAAAASAPAPPLGSEARARLVKDLYADSDLPDKPRNVLGFAKDLPTADMESRLKAGVTVDTDTMRALALQRGVSVRDALITRGLPGDRLFLAAPSLRSAEPGSAPAAWVPQAQLSLTLN